MGVLPYINVCENHLQNEEYFSYCVPFHDPSYIHRYHCYHHHCYHHCLVLATGPGNLPAVRVWTGKRVGSVPNPANNPTR